MRWPWQSPNRGEVLDFDSGVLQIERETIAARRRARGDSDLERAHAGLALSGGGIRSAATCIGAIQALKARSRFGSFDYISTVSGGGYAGACLSAAMSDAGGASYPFGDDVQDSPVLAHIRNYSNYLLPRSRSAAKSLTEATVVLLRGLLANTICVLAFMLPVVGLTAWAFPAVEDLKPNFVLHMARLEVDLPFLIPTVIAAVLGVVLLLWAALRSFPALDSLTNDTSSRFLRSALWLLLLLGIAFFLDLQPLAIGWLVDRICNYESRGALTALSEDFATASAFLATVAGVVSSVSGALGKFLKTSKRSRSWQVMGLRWATHLAIFVAALIVPVLLWVSYLLLTAWTLLSTGTVASIPLLGPVGAKGLVWIGSLVCWLTMLQFRSNGYSLHQLYRDRLSKAFLVSSRPDWPGVASKSLRRSGERNQDLPPLDRLKLSTLRNSAGPYPLINASLNVQGSLEANKRGREADFFTFTPHFIGSELTGFARTEAMERLDSRLDLASAMAISGAAASANMGGRTIRLLSPTLALLNVRLGYYLKNPRFVGARPIWVARVFGYFARRVDRLYLFIEMLNLLDERRRTIYLTDGGHLENLGVYELLRRRCGLVFAIDAEADPELSCESLLRLELFARIDLGIRIELPWEQIASLSRRVSAAIPEHTAPCRHGPHVAIGRISYPDGPEGLLVYVKCSLSGDEKDYLLDYAERNPDFPHETTGDQFFSEEQFEMYRALGFHMVSRLFGEDDVAIVEGAEGFPDDRSALAALDEALPAC